MRTVVWTGPGSELNRILRDFRKQHGLPPRDQAWFELSTDMYQSYRTAIVERMGGPQEYRRWRKKQPTASAKLRYSGYGVFERAELPPGTINFVD